MRPQYRGNRLTKGQILCIFIYYIFSNIILKTGTANVSNFLIFARFREVTKS